MSGREKLLEHLRLAALQLICTLGLIHVPPAGSEAERVMMSRPGPCGRLMLFLKYKSAAWAWPVHVISLISKSAGEA